MASRVRRHFVKEVTEVLQDSASRRALQLLLTKDEIWKVLVAETELPRDEEAALGKALRLPLELPTVEDKERLQKALQDRKWFMEDFPQLKRKLEGNSRKLQALTDHLDRCTGAVPSPTPPACLWLPGHPGMNSSTCDSRGHSATLSHWIGAGGSGYCE